MTYFLSLVLIYPLPSTLIFLSGWKITGSSSLDIDFLPTPLRAASLVLSDYTLRQVRKSTGVWSLDSTLWHVYIGPGKCRATPIQRPGGLGFWPPDLGPNNNCLAILIILTFDMHDFLKLTSLPLQAISGPIWLAPFSQSPSLFTALPAGSTSSHGYVFIQFNTFHPWPMIMTYSFN